MSSPVRVCVVGAGVAGLCALRHLKEDFPEAEVEAYEMKEAAGGTWLYSEATGENEEGVSLGTAMYKNLRANLPKQTMSFPDYPVPDCYQTFMTNEEFLKYIQGYAEHFNVLQHIKFSNMVTNISAGQQGGWEVTSKDLKNFSTSSAHYDWIFICNGHYSRPFIPDFKGRSLFKGKQIHSHDYRRPEVYKDKRVLLVGAGASGLDISIDVVKHCDSIFVSHHMSKPLESPYPENFHQKPDVLQLKKGSVVFIDGTEETIDNIIYCTGYRYSCPFLDPSCGVEVLRTYMYPLYRHIVNARKPSMFFIGVPQICCPVPLMDMQVKYSILIMKRDFPVPSPDAMVEFVDNEYESRKTLGPKKQYTHILENIEDTYFRDIEKESGVIGVPPVFGAIRLSNKASTKNLYTYRNYNYRILDDYHFEKHYDLEK